MGIILTIQKSNIRRLEFGNNNCDCDGDSLAFVGSAKEIKRDKGHHYPLIKVTITPCQNRSHLSNMYLNSILLFSIPK